MHRSRLANPAHISSPDLALCAGADPHEKDASGSTPLLHCAWPGNVEMTELLIHAKADPNLENSHGNTPLHFAFEKGHEDLIQYLLEHGAQASSSPYIMSS